MERHKKKIVKKKLWILSPIYISSSSEKESRWELLGSLVLDEDLNFGPPFFIGADLSKFCIAKSNTDALLPCTFKQASVKK